MPENWFFSSGKERKMGRASFPNYLIPIDARFR